MKKFLFSGLMILGLSGVIFAQQDPLYTQYRNNMLSVNPAYAGSRDALTVGLLHRSQWVGINGAPNTQTLTVHGPLVNRNLGFGFSVVHDQIGPTNSTGLYGDLSGRVRVTRNGYLAGGIKLGINFFQSNLTDVATGTQGDDAYSRNTSRVLPNLGFGLYYYTPKFYMGLSSPKLVQNVLYADDLPSGEVFEVTEKRHYFAIVGVVLELNPNLKFRPSVLARLVEGAPNSLDLTGSFIIADKFWIGAFYRYQESLGVLLDYNFTPQLKVGYSYDFTLTELQNYNSGSHEISITYDFIFNDASKIKSPRYF
ncbi:MAG: PorP/SprF family type IX secretion system membrane protein [Owenweeksia sp.]